MSGTTGPSYKIIISAGHNGNFGGTAGADAHCATTASSHVLTGTYKAMLVTNTRHACTTSNCGGGVSENLDWVLKPNTTYTQENGTQIGTTNASGIFQGTLSSSFGLSSSTPWTGLSNVWMNTATNCLNYTDDGTLSATSSSGSESATDSSAWSGLVKSCSSTWPIYCVEQ